MKTKAYSWCGRFTSNDSEPISHPAATTSLTTIDAKTFELKLNRPYGYVLEGLGKAGHQIPVIMPKRLADLPADKPVPEIVGSGPYIFRQDLWRPGNVAVLDRNPKDFISLATRASVHRQLNDNKSALEDLHKVKEQGLKLPPEFAKLQTQQLELAVRPSLDQGLDQATPIRIVQ